MEGSRCKSSRRASVAWVISVLAILMLFMYYGGQQNFNRSTTETRGHRLVSIRQGEDSDDMTRSQTGLSFSPNKIKLARTNTKNSNDLILKTSVETSNSSSRENRLNETFETPEDKANLNSFMKSQAEIQRQRKQTLQSACKKYKPFKALSKVYGVLSPTRFIVDVPHKLVYCSVAKVASTNWRWIFEQLSGSVNPGQEFQQEQINGKLKKRLTFMTDLPPRTVRKTQQSSLTFMFARHPFSRVLSAFRNKLDPNTTFERAHFWQSNLGVNIMKQYRRNSGNYKRSFLSAQYDLKFSEFVHYLGDKTNTRDSFYYNIHWVELNTECSPCDIDYDVIGKLETMDDDVKYILTLANLEDQVEFAAPGSSSPTYSYRNNTLEKYLESVPAPLIRSLYQRYELDFKLFGYELPDVAKRKLDEAKLRYR